MSTAALTRVATSSLVALSLFGAACSQDSRSTEPGTFVSDLEVFPFEGLSDWITYAEHIVLVEIVEEERLPPESLGPGDGAYVGRLVTASVESVLWSSMSDPLDPKIQILTDGWFEDGDDSSPVLGRGSARLEVGSVYVLPINFTDYGALPGGAWNVLTRSSIVPIANSKVRLRTASNVYVDTGGIDGLMVSELATLLAATVPDPLLERVDAGLSPTQRALAIANLREADRVEDLPRE